MSFVKIIREGFYPPKIKSVVKCPKCYIIRCKDDVSYETLFAELRGGGILVPKSFDIMFERIVGELSNDKYYAKIKMNQVDHLSQIISIIDFFNQSENALSKYINDVKQILQLEETNAHDLIHGIAKHEIFNSGFWFLYDAAKRAIIDENNREPGNAFLDDFSPSDKELLDLYGTKLYIYIDTFFFS